MSATPELKIIGITKEQFIKKVADLKRWFGDYKGPKTINITNAKYSDTYAQGEVILYGETVESLESRIADGTIDAFIKQFHKNR